MSAIFSYCCEHGRNLSFTVKKMDWEGKYLCVTYGLKQQGVSTWYDTWRPFTFWVYYQTPVQLLSQEASGVYNGLTIRHDWFSAIIFHSSGYEEEAPILNKPL